MRGHLPHTELIALEEFVQWLQFTASGLRDALSLECIDGRP